ncbi:MAG: hypothetical protein A2017_10685 [Lentisphaerae bacterium GWF2_44_16]|nr:MAG: hypothetical protein A2017_10685 [Lentisphaerae bacterium GWF2_44_16]
MNAIIKINTDEILINPDEVSQMLNTACRRHKEAMRVYGCCRTGNTLLLTMEETPGLPPLNYVFAQFPSMNEDVITGEINNRYFAGFTTITGFRIKDLMWGLFVYNPDNVSGNLK